jgi:hypothetical protein
VTADMTYYYVVIAVDGSGTESVYSNQVQAVDPVALTIPRPIGCALSKGCFDWT